MENCQYIVDFDEGGDPSYCDALAPIKYDGCWFCAEHYDLITDAPVIYKLPDTAGLGMGKNATFSLFYGRQMDILHLIGILIVVGFLLYLVNRIPMYGAIKAIINFIVVASVVLWLLSIFGLLQLANIPVPHYGK